MAIAELRRRPTKKPKYKNILMMETINANFKIAVHKKNHEYLYVGQNNCNTQKAYKISQENVQNKWKRIIDCIKI